MTLPHLTHRAFTQFQLLRFDREDEPSKEHGVEFGLARSQLLHELTTTRGSQRRIVVHTAGGLRDPAAPEAPADNGAGAGAGVGAGRRVIPA